jgi:oligosaccharide repeat unit polymerase
MMFLAVATWACYTLMLGLILIYGVRYQRLALISFALILFLVTNARQVLYFIGVARPHPKAYFFETEWELVILANLALISWVIISCISYEVNRPLSRLVALIFPAADPAPGRDRSPRGTMLALLPAFLISVGGTALLIVAFGGIARFTYAVKIGKDLSGAYAIRTMGSIASMLALYALFSTLKYNERGRIKLPRATIIYIAMVVLTLASVFAWGNRYALALTFIGYMIGWHLYVRRLNLTTMLMLALAASVTLQGLKLVRLALVSDVTGNQSTQEIEDIWLNVSLSLHLVEYDAFMLALRDAGNLFDFRGAQDFINGLLSWIPRSIYPDKETFHIGGWFRRVYEPSTINGWPVSTPGSWYVNFSFFGFAIGGWISGIFMRAFDTAFSGIKDSAWQAAIGPTLVFFVFGGGVSTGFLQSIMLFVVPLAAARLVISHMSKSQTARAAYRSPPDVSNAGLEGS